MQLPMDVLERARHRNAEGNREAQSMRLAGARIRVLADDHDLRIGVRREMQRSEDLFLVRVHDVFCDERSEVGPVRLLIRRASSVLPH
jgi:hypothetical protein